MLNEYRNALIITLTEDQYNTDEHRTRRCLDVKVCEILKLQEKSWHFLKKHWSNIAAIGKKGHVFSSKKN